MIVFTNKKKDEKEAENSLGQGVDELAAETELETEVDPEVSSIADLNEDVITETDTTAVPREVVSKSSLMSITERLPAIDMPKALAKRVEMGIQARNDDDPIPTKSEFMSELESELSEYITQLQNGFKETLAELEKEIREQAEKDGKQGGELENYVQEELKKQKELVDPFLQTAVALDEELKEIEMQQDQKDMLKMSVMIRMQVVLDELLQQVFPDEFFAFLDELLDAGETTPEEVLSVVILAYEAGTGESLIKFARDEMRAFLPEFIKSVKKWQEKLGNLAKMPPEKQAEIIELIQKGDEQGALQLLEAE